MLTFKWSGRNKTHDCIEHYKRIDSFQYRDSTDAVTGKSADGFIFHSVPNNYGGADRLYFECPCCKRRVRYLYRKGRYMCRICARLNYYSQQATKGTDAAHYRLKKILRDKFKLTGDYEDAIDLLPDRPKGMHWVTYNRLYEEFEAARDELNGCLLMADFKALNAAADILLTEGANADMQLANMLIANVGNRKSAGRPNG